METNPSGDGGAAVEHYNQPFVRSRRSTTERTGLTTPLPFRASQVGASLGK